MAKINLGHGQAVIHKRCGGVLIVVEFSDKSIGHSCLKCLRAWGHSPSIQLAKEWRPIKPSEGRYVDKNGEEVRTT